jgi:predicted PhzF superfamily epimerase YddE/YHI9
MGDTTVDVVSVFVDDTGAFGNELGIVESGPDTAGREQEIAAALGFSETVFLERGAGEVAAMRIFTPAAELPFAGHPSVGTAWFLARRGTAVRTLRVPAGDVEVRVDGDLTWIAAEAAWAPDFTWSTVDSPAELAALDPASFTEGHHYTYVWLDEAAGTIASRMFAPAFGIAEDQATGAAAIRLTHRLDRDLTIVQGEGSRLRTRRRPDGRIEVGGRTRFNRSLTV